MGVLHLVNRSPFESSGLIQCLERTGAGDAVLLLESGVYAVLRDSMFSSSIVEALSLVAIHVLAPDLEARGISPEEVLEGVSLVDYKGFVELTLRHSPMQSWF